MGLINLTSEVIGANVIINALKKQNPKELGIEVAQFIDKALDAQFGNKRSEKIQNFVVPFIKQFSDGVIEELKKDWG